MKTFLNVLYRRILYKIPLKLLLILLAVFGVLFACSNASYVTNGVGMLQYPGNSTNTLSFTNFNGGKGVGDTRCMINDPNNYCNLTATSQYTNESVTINASRQIACLTGLINSQYSIVLKNNSSSQCLQARFFLIDSENRRPDYTSLECQTEYNLIPISSVDQNYCTTNNLCPSSSPSDCPNVGVSNVFINDLFHPGSFNIIMNIPDEIDWDYAYTNSGQNMNIDVVGYNVDYEKIDSIVQFQNYKPTGEDFQKIIGLLAPYTKIIVFFVFLFIVWAWIKKPFKSKKL